MMLTFAGVFASRGIRKGETVVNYVGKPIHGSDDENGGIFMKQNEGDFWLMNDGMDLILNIHHSFMHKWLLRSAAKLMNLC